MSEKCKTHGTDLLMMTGDCVPCLREENARLREQLQKREAMLDKLAETECRLREELRTANNALSDLNGYGKLCDDNFAKILEIAEKHRREKKAQDAGEGGDE